MRRLPLFGFTIALLLLVLQPISAAAAGMWSSAGSMANARLGATATLLSSGKVLVAGGYYTSGSSLVFPTVAELYDPATGSWSLTGSMSTGHANHTATLLPSGQVVVASGSNGAITPLAELYDPASGMWSLTGPMLQGRIGAGAALLPSGKVLVTGGGGAGGQLVSAELYDPSTGLWSPTGSMAGNRASFGIALLPSGKVLVAGGSSTGTCNPSTATASAELYDPTTQTWSSAGSMTFARHDDTATLLPTGKVLIAGGVFSCGQDPAIAQSELYDPSTNSWSLTGSMNEGRYGHSAILLGSGQVLAVGGYNLGYLASAELYDPAAGTWGATGSMATARQYAAAALLNSGAVLVAGGQNSSGQQASAELFQTNDLVLAMSVTPNTATTGTTVTFNGSLTNTSSSSRSVQLTSTLYYTPPGGSARVVGTSNNIFTLGPGQTVLASTMFPVSPSTPRGTYTLVETATDSTGSTSASASLQVV